MSAAKVKLPDGSWAYIAVGVQGDKGDKGDKGDPGSATVPPFRQATPAASWTWTHNLGRKPSIVILLDDDPGHPVYTGDLIYIDNNTVNVSFDSPVTGYLHI